MSDATDHGTTAPEVSLHLRVIERPYRDGEEALEAIAADQINYRKLVRRIGCGGRLY